MTVKASESRMGDNQVLGAQSNHEQYSLLDSKVELEGPTPTSMQTHATLNQLRNLTVLSLMGYQDVAEFSGDVRLRSFATVILRQRSVQQRALYERIKNLKPTADDHNAETRVLLRALWRLAILSLQRREFGNFYDYVQRAESYLEEAYLSAASSLVNHELAIEVRDYSMMIYGARTIFEEFSEASGSTLADQPAGQGSEANLAELN